MRWKFWILVVSLCLLLIFVVQNYETVKIQFLFWAFKTSMAIVLFVSLIIGMIVGYTAAILRNKKS